MNYSLKIINSHDDTSFIPDLRMAKATFNLESMTNEIKFNIRAELTLGEWVKR